MKRSYLCVLIHIACEVITSVVVSLLATVHSSPGSSLAAYTVSSVFRHLFPFFSIIIIITVPFASYTVTRIFLNCF